MTSFVVQNSQEETRDLKVALYLYHSALDEILDLFDIEGREDTILVGAVDWELWYLSKTGAWHSLLPPALSVMASLVDLHILQSVSQKKKNHKC